MSICISARGRVDFPLFSGVYLDGFKSDRRSVCSTRGKLEKDRISPRSEYIGYFTLCEYLFSSFPDYGSFLDW